MTNNLFFYVTTPRKEICGYADFVKRKVGEATKLWKKLGHESLSSSYNDYPDFLQGRKQATFIRFRNLRELPIPITTKVLSQVVGIEKMRQMELYLTEKMAHKLLLEGGAEIGGI
jgi:predicted transcriptional regulator